MGDGPRTAADGVASPRCAARRAGTAAGGPGAAVTTIVERDDRLARPAGPVVDVEREPRRQQHQLRRHRGQLVPRPFAEQRQPDAREDPRGFDAPAGQDRTPGALRMWAASGWSPPGARRHRPRPSSTGRRVRHENVGPGPVVALLGADPAGRRAFELVGRRMPRNWRSSRSSASIVTFVASSPFHQPSGDCRPRSCWARAALGRARLAEPPVHAAAASGAVDDVVGDRRQVGHGLGVRQSAWRPSSVSACAKRASASLGGPADPAGLLNQRDRVA